MGKSHWRLKFIAKSTMSKIIKESIGVKIKKKNSIIMNKSSTIPSSLTDNIFFIHKGKKYRELKLLDFHVGFKFGEFILTRKPHVYPKKSKKKSKSFRR
uniref:Ribosomal protein S19 n=1 Tax=Tetrahymena rostrata TaxID=5909 RepID=A0A6G5NK08_TETRO|nr:ribosomal proten S19 [Tetrahymena rostrata]QBI37920.1 ribosomal protein S19 [Tetrahymena rostrata]URP31110.1 ribosomal proten S19 [Tetrahymena rostrata]